MASIFVEYETRSHHGKIHRNGTLKQFLDDSIVKFGLKDELHGDVCWNFEYNGRAVPTDIPWSLLNLPPGAKLQLIRTQPQKHHHDHEPELLKIKFMIPGAASVLASVNNKQSLKDVVDKIVSELGGEVDLLKTSLQVFGKFIAYQDLEKSTLHNLGVNQSTSMRLNVTWLTSHDVKAADNIPNSSTDQKSNLPLDRKNNKEVDDATFSKEKTNLAKHHVSVFKPSNRLLKDVSAERDDFNTDMTVEEARKYQQMLSRKAGTNHEGILTKRLRQKLQEENKSKKKEVTHCIVRFRFPDRVTTEIVFAPTDTMETVYSVLERSLINLKMDFVLKQSFPYKRLDRNFQSLVNDLGFGTKTMLIFETDSPAPYLKENLIHKAKSFTEAEDVKFDNSLYDAVKSSDAVSTESSQVESVSKLSIDKKLPKWFKLNGKK